MKKKEKKPASKKEAKELRLVTCVVQRGKAQMVAKAALEVGAPGVTILEGRGMGVRERLGPAGRSILPEKEVLLIVCEQGQVRAIFDTVAKVANLKVHGMGIAFVCPVFEVAGLVPPRVLR